MIEQEKYISSHTKEVEKNLNRLNDYLYKIIESNTLSSISNLLFEVQKLFYLKTNDHDNFLELIDRQKGKIVKTYSNDSIELRKFLVNNSVHFTELDFSEIKSIYTRSNKKDGEIPQVFP